MIAIIDDDASVLEATARLVRSLGHRAEMFSSAEEFLHSGQVWESSCLITDLHMPGMSGSDLQNQLIADGHQTPIIFMTAYFEEKSRERLLGAGASGYLRKPFDDESLIECLDEALKSSGAGRAE